MSDIDKDLARKVIAWLRGGAYGDIDDREHSLPGFREWSRDVSLGCDDEWASSLEALINEHPRAAAERRIVEQLSRVMLAKLAERRGHGSWEQYSTIKALAIVERELAEMNEALDALTTGTGTREELAREIGDVANGLAILLDVVMQGVEQ